MRLNNNKRYLIFKYVYLFLLLVVGFDFLFYNIEGSYGTYGFVATPGVIAVVILLMYRGNPIFRYDSDGEVLILDSKEPILGRFLRSNKLYEFPKRKLLSYRIKSWPFRRTLYLKVSSKESKFKMLKVTISYLTRSEVRDLARSLESVVKTNKNNNHEDDQYGDW